MQLNSRGEWGQNLAPNLVLEEDAWEKGNKRIGDRKSGDQIQRKRARKESRETEAKKREDREQIQAPEAPDDQTKPPEREADPQVNVEQGAACGFDNQQGEIGKNLQGMKNVTPQTPKGVKFSALGSNGTGERRVRRPLTVKEILKKMADLKLSKTCGNGEQGKAKLDPGTSGFAEDEISGETGRQITIKDNPGGEVRGHEKVKGLGAKGGLQTEGIKGQGGIRTTISEVESNLNTSSIANFVQSAEEGEPDQGSKAKPGTLGESESPKDLHY